MGESHHLNDIQTHTDGPSVEQRRYSEVGRAVAPGDWPAGVLPSSA